MGSLDVSVDGSNDDKNERLLHGDSLGYTDIKVLGYYEVIKMGLYDGKVLVTILLNVYGITLGIDVGTELGSLDGYLDGSDNNMLGGLLLGYSLEYTDGKVLGTDEGIKLGLSGVKCLAIHLET